jgi:C4-dicarboxylate-specific signal transduction histidine kinase
MSGWWRSRAALALAGAQTLLIAGLLIQSRRRRRAAKALEESERGSVGSGADITEVKLAQQAMAESLTLGSALVGSLRRPVAAVDRTGRIPRRRRAEEEVQRDREELAHALRSATLGELATSLAHEINQPLAAIASNAQAARRLLGPAQAGGEIPAVLQDIAADAQRAAQVIRRLRALFRKEQGERHAVDMTAVIREVISLLRKDLDRRRICLELALPPDTPRVLGDVVQLEQVILNVLLNAAEAMTDEAHARVLRIEADARESGILTITVRDSGRGAEASELEHIFDRFVTSKADGLGMGLSTSRSIVKAHGGRMWATRNMGHGLTMHIELPSLEREPEHQAR